jgi:hypothetical protein
MDCRETHSPGAQVPDILRLPLSIVEAGQNGCKREGDSEVLWKRLQ